MEICVGDYVKMGGKPYKFIVEKLKDGKALIKGFAMRKWVKLEELEKTVK